jgi:cysteine-S-conjugate beta-lyase
MGHDFDRVRERGGTSSLKWDTGPRQAGRGGPLPLWVADMDFEGPPEVRAAVERRAAHGIFGYTVEPDSLFEAAAGWLSRRHGWRVQRDWMLCAPGVVPSIALAIQAFTAPGERVVIQPPVYHPFASCIRSAGRVVAENPLLLNGTRYEMDLDGLERMLDGKTRLLILCSPHNPVGRVWGGEELSRLAGICARRGVVLVSDEIHLDIVMDGFRHRPTASVSAEAAGATVMLFGPTKTFNIAGLGGSFAVIADEALRARFLAARRTLSPGLPNPLSLAGQEAAYRHGEGWLSAVLAYIRGNFEHLCAFTRARLPRVAVFPLEATYLAWLDMRALGVPDAELRRRLLEDAGVWLDEGVKFGSGGEGFQRLNLACPRAILTEALERLARAFGG